MIYDFPITKTSSNSTAFNYALACTKAALFPSMTYQDPREDSEETSGTMQTIYKYSPSQGPASPPKEVL